MPLRTIAFPLPHGRKPVNCYLAIGVYVEPTDPYRLMVKLQMPESEPGFAEWGQPWFGVASTNMPNLPNPGPRQFYFKTWSENEGMMETMVAAGAIRVVDPAGIPINQWGSKVYQVELLWPDSDMLVQLPAGARLKSRTPQSSQRPGKTGNASSPTPAPCTSACDKPLKRRARGVAKRSWSSMLPAAMLTAVVAGIVILMISWIY